MNNDRTKKRSQSNTPIIPDELIAEILILLNLKTIVLFKCVSKSWNTLISDPIFIKNHLKKSSQNPRLILTPFTSKYPISSVESFPVSRLLENSSTIVSSDNCHGSEDNCQVVGSCNGLLCLLFHSRYKKSYYVYQKYWFCLWNPATRTKSEKLGIFKDYINIYLSKPYKFTFGCDISTGTYKVVSISEKPILSKQGEEEDVVSWKCEVRIFSFGDNCWRKIQDFPLFPVCVMNILINRINNGVHLNGTLNWLCLPDFLMPSYEYGWKSITNAQQFAIVSLDLSTETYKQLLLPQGFDEVPEHQPTLHVLKDCLCFSHDFKTTEFVIWQMKEFGIQESWTQLFRIDYFKIYHNLNFYGLTECGIPLLPLYLSTDGDTLILANSEDDRAIIYNRREKRVERIRISNKLCWFSAMDYVESLVWTCWKSANLTPTTSSLHESMVGNSVLFPIERTFVIVGDSGAEEEGPLLSENLDDDELSEGGSEDELGNGDSEDGEIVGGISEEEEGPLLSEDLNDDELSEVGSDDELGNGDSEDGEIVGGIGEEEKGPLLSEDLDEDELGNSDSEDDG